MKEEEPTIRAAQTQMLLQATTGLSEDEQRAILAKVSPGLVAEIHKNLPVSWHSMSLHMELSDAIRDVVGPQRNVALWQTTMEAAWSRPLLRGFVDAVGKVFGIGPEGLIKQSPRVYGHLTRGLGKITSEVRSSASSGVLTLEGFPSRRYRFICFVEGLQGCIQSALPLTRRVGTVTVVDRDDARGSVRYIAEWS